MTTTTKMLAPNSECSSTVSLGDGTTATIDAYGFADIPFAFVSDMLNAGWTIVGSIAAKSTALSSLTSSARISITLADGTTAYIPIVSTWS